MEEKRMKEVIKKALTSKAARNSVALGVFALTVSEVGSPWA
jgi:hypothetical protein